MHGWQKGRKTEELASITRWLGGYRIPTVHERNKLGITTNLYIYDGRTWVDRTPISNKEFSHRIAIIFASTAAFGTGVGVLLRHFFGGW